MRKNFKMFLNGLKTLLPMGLFSGLGMVSQMTALQLALVSYVISIKRTSAIISVCWGHWIFKEKGFKERLWGTVLMVIGVLLIALTH